MTCLFTFQDSGAQTLVTGTNVSATRNSTGLVTVTFTDVNIYRNEVPVIVPTVYLATAAVVSCHIGAVTETAATATLTVQVRFEGASGLTDLVDNTDQWGLIVSYRKSNS
jgi:hypothetical protein